MKDFTAADKAKFESFVRNHIAHILICANLSHYYLRNLEPQKMMSAFTIVPDPQYLEFRLWYGIKYATDEMASGSHEDVIRTLCHEVTHIVTGEIEIIPKLKKMNEVVDPLFERMTEHTSRWLYRNYIHYMRENEIVVSTGAKKK